jgi:hypothetical protein
VATDQGKDESEVTTNFQRIKNAVKRGLPSSKAMALGDEDIQSLKFQAKQLAKTLGCKRHQALDEIARKQGYADWASLMSECAKKYESLEQVAKENGLGSESVLEYLETQRNSAL